jgi:hypothetical protein
LEEREEKQKYTPSLLKGKWRARWVSNTCRRSAAELGSAEDGEGAQRRWARTEEFLKPCSVCGRGIPVTRQLPWPCGCRRRPVLPLHVPVYDPVVRYSGVGGRFDGGRALIDGRGARSGVRAGLIGDGGPPIGTCRD